MKSYRCDDWIRLAGVNVEIHKDGRLVRAGVVDAVMPDAKMLWLASDHNGNRALFESKEGHEVWVDPQDLPDERCAVDASPAPDEAGAQHGSPISNTTGQPREFTV